MTSSILPLCMLSILSLGLIKALSGLNETLVLSPLDLTEIGLAVISALDNLTFHFPPDISETSPLNVLFSPINSATKELTGFSYNSSGLESC